jgi:hypothetical protein
VSKLIERISEMFGKNEEPDSTEEVLSGLSLQKSPARKSEPARLRKSTF